MSTKTCCYPLMLALVGAVLAGCGAPPAATRVTPTAAAPVPPATSAPAPTSLPTATSAPTAAPPTAAPPTPTAATTPSALWVDATERTIGVTAEWTNKVELADINGDGMVDLLFANGGDYETPGTPVVSQVFLNQGPGQPFAEANEAVFGPEGRLTRVIKVCELSGDGQPDIVMGTT